MRALSRIRGTRPFTLDIAAIDAITAWKLSGPRNEVEIASSPELKNNPRSGARMARNLHLFAYFMKSAPSTLHCIANEILAQPEPQRALKKFFIFFLASRCGTR
jgi:hypothetical protein